MQRCFVAIAVVLFVIAVYFGNQTPFHQVTGGGGGTHFETQVAIASNWVAAGASFGFSLAGGLALIAAALAKESR